MRRFRFPIVLAMLFAGGFEAQAVPPVACTAAMSIAPGYVVNGNDTVPRLVCNPAGRLIWTIDNASGRTLWVGFGNFKTRAGGNRKDPVSDPQGKKDFYVFRVNDKDKADTARLLIDATGSLGNYKYDVRIWTSNPDKTFGNYDKAIDPDLDVTPPPEAIEDPDAGRLAGGR